MTPVRWKLPLAVLLLGTLASLTNSAKIELMSMADDGWRPIVGSQRDAPYEEITHYRNPASKKSDPVKAEKQLQQQQQQQQAQSATLATKLETPSSISKKAPSGSTHISHQQNMASNLGPVAKLAPHSKPVFLMSALHSPQLVGGISSMHHQHHHRPHKYSHLMKVHHHGKPPRGKPLRHQLPAYSTRDEVFVPAPSSNINVGPYTFYSAGQPQLKPRPTHIDFANHFPVPNTEDELYQIVRAPVHQYVIPKAPIANDVHYTFQNPEDFRNINPPAPYKFEPTKEKIKKHKEPPRQEALIQKHNVHPFHLTTSQPQPNNQVEVHVTKEKLKVFHNSIPSNYSPLDDYEYRPVKTTPSQKHAATYEVTEGKWNQETPIFQYHYATPTKNRIPSRIITEENKPFLPTPVKPENVRPTLPTESEISTIYNQIKYNRQKEFSTPPPINFFDVKEVSTHFPILGPPEFQTISYPTRFLVTDDKENEITSTQHQEPETTTTYIPTIRPLNRNRRPNRRRRPSSTSTTEPEEIAEVPSATDAYEPQKTETIVEVTTQRIRRPSSRYRSTSTTTTTQQPEVEVTTRLRQRRPRPTTTEEPSIMDIPDNHKVEYESLEEKFARLTTTTEKDFPANFASHFTAPFKSEPPSTEIYEKSTEEVFRPNRFYTNPPTREEKGSNDDEDSAESDSASVEETSDEKEEEMNLEDYRVQYHESKKEPEVVNPEITINTPENELDFTTRHSYYTTKQPKEESTTEAMPTTTTTTTTTTTPAPTTTTTTTAATTTTSTTTEAPKRVRGRPVKYDNSNRPRFSVKEYRQRLSTSTTSTETPKTQNDVMRIRFPNRSRRPITPTPSTTTAPITDDDDAVDDDDGTPKSKFHPKDPRHPNLDSTTEKLKFNTVNTRIRPFGRFKSTTESSPTTLRVSIKPNIFSNLRRPTPISLKTRIMNRQRTGGNTTVKPEIVTTLDNIQEDNSETDQTEIVETTIPYSVEESEVDTAFDAKKVAELTTNAITTLGEEYEPETKSDDFMQSQIVSDLTSSAKNEYHKPGLFKNVQPNSRKVPSYFTLATDDPILPIEAFFPNLKEKQ